MLFELYSVKLTDFYIVQPYEIMCKIKKPLKNIYYKNILVHNYMIYSITRIKTQEGRCCQAFIINKKS